MSFAEEIVVSLPLIATFLAWMWPQKQYAHTPLDKRVEPTVRSTQ